VLLFFLTMDLGELANYVMWCVVVLINGTIYYVLGMVFAALMNLRKSHPTITQQAVVPLPQLVGGTGVTCYMAQNPTYVYASTNQSTELANINKTNYAMNFTGGFDLISSITANSYGFVTVVTFENGLHSYSVIGPNGEGQGGGGGDYFLINPIDGLTPADYPSPAVYRYRDSRGHGSQLSIEDQGKFVMGYYQQR